MENKMIKVANSSTKIPNKKSREIKKPLSLGYIIKLIIIIIAAVIFIAPIILTIAKSFKYGDSYISLQQYWELFVTNNSYLNYFWNSVFYAVIITFFCIITAIPLAFLFSKVTFFGRDAIFFIYILIMMLPFQATLLPNYIQLKQFSMLNTPYALAIPAIFSPFAVFLLRQFMKPIQNELIDYTLLETSSVIKVIRFAVFPQIKPAIISLMILIFCESWNMVEQALIFTASNQPIMPLSVVLTTLPSDVAYAGATVYMFPIIILFFMFRETLESSMENYKW